MAASVIDQLTVKLGLDPAEFKKGVGEAKKSLDELKDQSSDAGNTLGDMLGGGAKKATGSLGTLGATLGKGGMIGIAIGAAIYAAKKLDDTLFDVALNLRQLSIDSKNVGQSASGLRNLQNASELVGGSMEDATQTVNDLQKSLFNLNFNGQISDSLIMLSRLGVDFQDEYGKARDFNDVLLDIASSLEAAQKSGEMTRPEAFQAAQQAGLTGGMAQLALSGRAGVQAELAKQSARTQVTEGVTGPATRVVRTRASLGQAAIAEGLNRAVGATGELEAKGQEELERGVTAAPKMLEDGFNVLSDAVRKATTAVTDFGAALGNKIFELFHPTAASEPASAAPAAIENKTSFISQMGAAARQLGLQTVPMSRDIFGLPSGPALTGPGSPENAARAAGFPGANNIEETAAGFQPGSRTVNNDVYISQITVNTQATDAEGIAGAIGPATQRKLMSAQAEGGIQ